MGDNCLVNLTLKRGDGIFIFGAVVLPADSPDSLTPGGPIDFTVRSSDQQRMLADNPDAVNWSSSSTTAAAWDQQAIIYSYVTV